MCRALRPTALALATLAGTGGAAAQSDPPAGGVEWLAEVKSHSRAPSLHRRLGQATQVAYAGVRVPIADGEYLMRLIASESVLGDGLQQRSSFGSAFDLFYELGDHGELALAVERLDNTHPADQGAKNSVTYAARGVVSQRLAGAATPELRLQTEVASEVNRRGNPGLSGVTASALAEIAVAPAPAWELSFGLSAESARFREPPAGSSAAHDDRYGGVVLAAEHALSPISRLRCEAEAGMMRSTDRDLDGPQRLFGCSVRIEL